MIAGIFAPYDVTTGCDPALYGLLGVMLVELFQSWQIVEHPYRELAKVGGLCFILIFIGTFPFLDNWSHIGGFLFGKRLVAVLPLKCVGGVYFFKSHPASHPQRPTPSSP